MQEHGHNDETTNLGAVLDELCEAGLLPEGARLIWNVLDDAAAMRGLLRICGGQTLRVPARPPRKPNALWEAVGEAGLRKLVAAFGGTRLYVPRCRVLLARVRRREIVRDFSRRTRAGSGSVAAVAWLARRYSLSDRRVWQILKTEEKLPSHAAMLDFGRPTPENLPY